MDEPVNHHFVPRFLQRRWLHVPGDANGRVYRYTLNNGHLIKRLVSTKAAGSERELYSQRLETDPAERQALESRFFKDLDNDAAKALIYMEGRPRQSPFIIVPTFAFPAHHREAWARFLVSMAYRSPYRVRWMMEQLLGKWSEVPVLQKTYTQVRSPDDPKELTEFVAEHAEGIPLDVGTMSVIQSIINSSLIIPHICKSMRWKLITTPPGAENEFLLSDEPVMISNGLNRPDSFIVMPTGPHNVFVAGGCEEVVDAFFDNSASALARAFNDATVRQANSVIISYSESLDDFIAERFGTDPGDALRADRFTWASPIAFPKMIG